jgi:hypothetical protein
MLYFAGWSPGKEAGTGPSWEGMVKPADKDNDNVVTLEEAKAAHFDAFFKSLDANGDGKVTPDDLAAMHRKTLVASGAINDEEVLPGVEDLQVEYGVDTNPVGSATRGSITRYVTADDPVVLAPDTEVLAVRVWVRLRAERPENGFTDTAEYVYADRDDGPFNDAFRRLVVSKTIYLRNARPAS